MSTLSIGATRSVEVTRPIVLSIAGSDSAGMAGVSRDSHTIQALGAHAANIITACTAQNSAGLISVNACDANGIKEQLNATLASADSKLITAIKIGLLANAEQVRLVAESIKTWRANYTAPNTAVIVDPVFAASSGEAFVGKQRDNKLERTSRIVDFIQALIRHLIPLCTLITPNIEEASLLSGQRINSSQDMESAAAKLLSFGAQAVLIKGGHSENSTHSQDYFHSKDRSFWLSSERITSKNTRGTGCTLSSAIAAAIGLKYSMYDAVVIGKMAINQALANGYNTAAQAGPAYCTQFPNKQWQLPKLTLLPNEGDKQSAAKTFPCASLPSGDMTPLGLYPVVDSAQWCERLLPLGISTLQLRVKQLAGQELENEIIKAVALAQQYNCRLFINDYWELAIKHGAYGIHLGQEDLDDANLNAIKQAGLRLGISSHCHYEVARAHAHQPSYIACGPVFHTTSKDMPWVPHGANGFAYWRSALDYPMVAIGGINAARIQPMLEAGADGIAMISAITEATDPELITKAFVRQIKYYQESAHDRS